MQVHKIKNTIDNKLSSEAPTSKMKILPPKKKILHENSENFTLDLLLSSELRRGDLKREINRFKEIFK